MGFRPFLAPQLWSLVLAVPVGAGPVLSVPRSGQPASADAARIQAYREEVADQESNLPILLDLDAAAILARHLRIGVQVVRAGPGPEEGQDGLEIELGPVLNQGALDPGSRHSLLVRDGSYAVLESGPDGQHFVVQMELFTPEGSRVAEDGNSLVRALFFLRHQRCPDDEDVAALRRVLARELTEGRIRQALKAQAKAAKRAGTAMIRRFQCDLQAELRKDFSQEAVGRFSGTLAVMAHARKTAADGYRKQQLLLAELETDPEGPKAPGLRAGLLREEALLRAHFCYEGNVFLPALHGQCFWLVRALRAEPRQAVAGKTALKLKRQMEKKVLQEMLRLQRHLAQAWDRDAEARPWCAWRMAAGEQPADQVADLLTGWQPMGCLRWPVFLKVVERSTPQPVPAFPGFPLLERADFLDASIREREFAAVAQVDLAWLEEAPAPGPPRQENPEPARAPAPEVKAERRRRLREREERAHQRNLERRRKAAEEARLRAEALREQEAAPEPQEPEDVGPVPPPPAPDAGRYEQLRVRTEGFLQGPRPALGFAARVYDWFNKRQDL
jgi:hypothetical protein